jgi:GT2 family glycosyltransferase
MIRALAGTCAASVVVASHARHLRLLWLLNALEDQTFSEPWEVVVVHDYDEDTAARIISSHPLSREGRLTSIAIEPGTGSPARQRNLGWRAARGELIAFTDDDCRPEPAWLERLVAAARAAPGSVVQGRTQPDPLEYGVRRAPHVRTMNITPVGRSAQTCNILYRRSALEALSGFDEYAITGEDTDLWMRARASGCGIVPAADAVVSHAVESHTLPGILRSNLKWRHLAYLVKQHPELRETLPLRIFWDDHHLRTVGLMLALGLTRRHPAAAVCAVPYVVHHARRRGSTPRMRLVAVAEIPGQAVRQIAEVLGLAAGSVRERTLVL